jgi:hypothetical protein
MRAKQASCHRCQRRRGFVLLDIIFGLCRAFERFGPLVLLFALTAGAASADESAGFMKLSPWPSHDMMGPLRVFPTRARVLRMLRFGAPIYGLEVQEVTSVRPGPNEGSDKTGVASYRYRYRGCKGSAQVHLIGGEEIEGWWRLRDIAELQHVGDHCGK